VGATDLPSNGPNQGIHHVRNHSASLDDSPCFTAQLAGSCALYGLRVFTAGLVDA
jgi:hypothetical protein